jgi:hypothetical protein
MAGVADASPCEQRRPRRRQEDHQIIPLLPIGGIVAIMPRSSRRAGWGGGARRVRGRRPCPACGEQERHGITCAINSSLRRGRERGALAHVRGGGTRRQTQPEEEGLHENNNRRCCHALCILLERPRRHEHLCYC